MILMVVPNSTYCIQNKQYNRNSNGINATRSRIQSTSENYYNNLKQRLNNDGIKLYEDFDTLKSLNILIDYDPSTKPKIKS